MATQKLFKLKSHFNLADKGFFAGFLLHTMARFANSFWVLLCTSMFCLLGFIAKCISRFKADNDSRKNDFNYSTIHPRKDDDQIIFSHSSKDSEPGGFDDKEYSKFSFGPYFEEDKYSMKVITETENSFFTGRYQYKSGKDVCEFMEKPEKMSFAIQEMYARSDEDLVSNHQDSTIEKFYEESKSFSTANDESTDILVFNGEEHQGFSSETECFHEDKAEDCAKSSRSEEVTEKKDQLCSHQEMDSSEYEIFDGHGLSCKVQSPLENQFLSSDSNSESDSSSDRFFISTLKVDSDTDEFVLDEHVNEALESDINRPIDEKIKEFIENFPGSVERSTGAIGISHGEEAVSKEKTGDLDDEYIELEACLANSSELDSSKGSEPMDGTGKSEYQSSEMKYWDWDSDSDLDLDDEDESDILREHKIMVEQIKMEMRNSRTGGLPTILEECETPKMAEDLKPLKIDEKIGHKDRMEEIQKFHKSYAEKMRKLDILNYQTMQAIGFLQLKDPIQLTSGQKSSASVMKSLILQQFWPCKLRRVYADPTLKSVKELHRDLEVVYVGQLCLSWEILCWQHRKAKELLDHEPQGYYSYNKVAGEFQQFQVLVQRFVEDEPFQGPRVLNYANKRCLVRGFLQVPIIRDDCLKDKRGRGDEEEDAISIAMLVDIVGEAMEAFWEFLRADKHEINAIFKHPQGTRIDHQDHSSSELLMDIKTSLQKKEKRLKDILRTRNCIVKMFQKHQGGQLDNEMLLSQVELRLLWRALCLPRLTADQLAWCQRKLGNINFVNRRIYVESSFLLFPC